MKVKTLLYLSIIIALGNCKPTEKQGMETKMITLAPINNYIEANLLDFNKIPDDRKLLLNDFAGVIAKDLQKDTIKINFICTHNSRRSHLSQIWARTAAVYYGLNNVECYSGGTEATAFNPRAVKAMKNAGFNISTTDTSSNPVYDVKFSDDFEPIKAFSKKYDDDFNPQSNFIALMTCDHANEACPIVYGSSARVAVTYQDPKVADDTPQEEEKYAERCLQIGNEMFYVFNKVKELVHDKG